MYIQLHWDEYKALLKGQYTLLPCAECEKCMGLGKVVRFDEGGW